MQLELFGPRAKQIERTDSNISASSLAGFRYKLMNSNCQRCNLAQSRKNIVVSRGNPGAKIMVVGRDPGEIEEQTLRPFTGTAGKLFDKIMEDINIDTNLDFYITNVFKCRPTDNKLPGIPKTIDYMKQCWPFLKQEIDLLDPSLIITLGKEAFCQITATVYDSTPITPVIGKLHMSQHLGVKCQILALYHPAFIARNRHLTETYKNTILHHRPLISRLIGRTI